MSNRIENSNTDIDRLIHDSKERLKELACINNTNQIIRSQKSVDETLKQITQILPPAWQYPEATEARIVFDNKVYTTSGFKETKWKLSQSFHTIDGKSGQIEVYYTRYFKKIDEGPFLKEERHLIDNLASIIANYLNSVEAKLVLKDSLKRTVLKPEISEFKEPVVNSRQLLKKFLTQQNANRDILYDLMPFKVKEILLVAALYDAFTIEKEGRVSEQILGEYHHLNLTSMPRITNASTPKEAFGLLNRKHFDMIIIMMGSDKNMPFMLSRKVKEEYPYIPIFLMLNDNREMSIFKNSRPELDFIDKIFVWNGDTKVFFTMVKLLEDKVNVENDTTMGLVKVILLVEDSEKYYTRYLPLLYDSVFEQTRRIIEDVSTDELFKVLRLRARPKILLASTYEEALDIYSKYRESLLCLITDVKFNRDGVMDDEAGFALARYARSQIDDLPIIIQSSDTSNAKKTFELKSTFINKNSESLLQDVRTFIKHHLGFGNFIYRDAAGMKIAVAKSLREFEKQIETIPSESLVYHGRRNHFSLWLMARGEIKIAKMIHPVKVSDFSSSNEFRNYLRYVIKKYRNESHTGKVIQFEENAILEESNIVSLGSGALGGKGRGLAFINSLIYNLNFSEIVTGINIRTPKTTIIGTDEFDMFIEQNNLHETIYGDTPFDKLRKTFLKAELSYGLSKKLKALLKLVKGPLAIRSSSLFEDSTVQPFSGVFSTYLLPNNHPDFKVRLKQLINAIKLVYASVYSDDARRYFDAIHYKIEEEKMAVIIQEVVGNQFDQYCYPHISGTAQSHNFYPVAHMQPEDGFAVIALGLGQYVVSGEPSYRFSPRYPDIDILSPAALLKNSQLKFYAIDMQRMNSNLMYEGEKAGLSHLDISEAEKHKTLTHLASRYDVQNDRIESGLSGPGPRVINFANILKYNCIPLAKTLETVLELMKEALGAPVEIEFAVDLDTSVNGLPSFYLLQMKPLLGSEQDFAIDETMYNEKDIILRSEKSLGNGKIENISDIIYVIPERFDNTKTIEMVSEIEKLNNKMMKEKRQYVLIGPGRWGTQDRFLGIPVTWPQICNAKVIVEMSLEGFPLDASLGSHFFHNVTSMSVGYFSVSHNSKTNYLNMDLINMQETIEETKYFRHVNFRNPLKILMDGKKRLSLMLLNEKE